MIVKEMIAEKVFAEGVAKDIRNFLPAKYENAKKVNTTGDLYPEEMQELKEMVKELWHILRSSPLK